MKARIYNLDIDFETDKGKVVLEVDKRQLSILEKLKERELDITIKEYKEPRGNQSNSYMWVIIQEMADKLNTSKEELYKKYVKEKGLFRIIEVNKSAVNTMRKIWHERGLGWFSEIYKDNGESVEIILYYGTSSYDTKQMSTFIDYIVQDAKELGIDTTTLEEQERLNNL